MKRLHVFFMAWHHDRGHAILIPIARVVNWIQSLDDWTGSGTGLPKMSYSWTVEFTTYASSCFIALDGITAMEAYRLPVATENLGGAGTDVIDLDQHRGMGYGRSSLGQRISKDGISCMSDSSPNDDYKDQDLPKR